MEIFINSQINSVKGFIVHLIVAVALGGIIGLERQWTRHQAGILTNLIVCLGAYSFTAFGYLIDSSSVDITRIAAQVVCGIGFLGAGIILHEGGNVRGLNTAATVWASAAVGILCCLNNLAYAVLVTVVLVILHLVLHPLSDQINKIKKYDKTPKKKRQEAMYKITVVCPEEFEPEIRKNIMSIIKNEPDALLHNLESTHSTSDEHNKRIRAYISTKTDNDSLVESFLTKIGKNEEIISAGWKVEHD